MKIAPITLRLAMATTAAVLAAGCLARAPESPEAATTATGGPPPATPAAAPPPPAPPTAAAAWRPILFNAIKYDSPTAGPLSRKTARELGIPTMPIAYHGGVDWYSDGAISPRDKELFRDWIERSFPADYTGPACLDYEAPYFPELCAKTIEPARLREILAVYDEGLAFARSLRPRAAWGYWGIPAMRHTSSAWKGQGHSLRGLMLKGGAIFPAAYDCHPGTDNTESFRSYVAQAIADVSGKVPVYAFVWNRFCGQRGKHVFASDDEMLANADAVLRARWTDDEGVEHRVAGIALWDSLKLAPGQTAQELDRRHATYLEQLDALVKSHALVASGE